MATTMLTARAASSTSIAYPELLTVRANGGTERERHLSDCPYVTLREVGSATPVQLTPTEAIDYLAVCHDCASFSHEMLGAQLAQASERLLATMAERDAYREALVKIRLATHAMPGL